ncbi:MAG: hypothetical protein AAF799_44290 [Myxococcota bacterium]
MTRSNDYFLGTSLAVALGGLLAGFSGVACDLPDEDLGSDSATSTSGGESGDAPVCMDGQTMMPDSCNTCFCEDGGWACTEIGCGDGTGGDDSGQTCDPDDLPPEADCSNNCGCEDGEWVCDLVGCADSGDTTTGGGNPTGGGTDGKACNFEPEPKVECNECICDEEDWACTDFACPTAPPVTVCSGADLIDPHTVLNANIIGHELFLTLESSGGCAEHVYGNCWEESFENSLPPMVSITVTHDSNADPCEALVMEETVFDLMPLRNAYIEAYQELSGTMTVNVAGWGPIDYTF